MSFNVDIKQWTEAELVEVQRDPEGLADLIPDYVVTEPKSVYLPDGCVLYLGSTQPKKFDEIAQARRFSNRNIDLQDALSVLHWFHSADEESQTYIGNAYEKLSFILDRIYKDIGYNRIVSRIREQGKDPSKAIFGVNDTGMSLTIDYSKEPEFKVSAHEKFLGSWPGVELGPITDAQGGITGFYSALHDMVKRKRKEGIEPDLTATDDNVYLFFKLVEKREDVEIFSFESHVPIVSLTKASAAKSSDVLNSYHFSKSTDALLLPYQREMTRHELGNEYLGVHSAQARGVQAFIDLARIPHSLSIAFDPSAERKKRPVIVSTQHNALPEKKVKQFLPNAFFREEAIENYTGNSHEIRNGAYQAMTRDSSVVVLGEHSKEVLKNYNEYFLDLFDLWCSLHVDKQLRIATFENTPFIVLNKESGFESDFDDNDWNSPEVEKQFVEYLQNIDPKKDPWLTFILFTKYLHEKGFVKQEPRFLHTQMDPDDPNLVKKIHRELDIAEFNTTHIPTYEREQFGKDEFDQFEVSVLGSASTRVADYCEQAFDLGYWITSNGWHLRTGGGRHGVMGNASEGGLRAKSEDNGYAESAHISAIQMPNTILFEGAIFHQDEAKNSEDKTLIIEDSFDSRMQSIFRSNISVAMAPGIGTYQEVIRWLRIKEAGAEHLQNQKLIIINSVQPNGNGKHIRIFDAFLALLPDDIKNKHLTIVNDVEGAKEELDIAYENWLKKEFRAVPAAKIGPSP